MLPSLASRRLAAPRVYIAWRYSPQAQASTRRWAARSGTPSSPDRPLHRTSSCLESFHPRIVADHTHSGP
ncbi:hypothetical protein C2E23DRAFT_853146 [Lenzites betulinus]|nr:hypothetical protein C2E23DRAFT_853146 [Lenzites betulinus]